jgi:hypothetical protein
LSFWAVIYTRLTIKSDITMAVVRNIVMIDFV